MRLLRNHSGMTLVELLISTALFGVLALAMASLFAESAKRIVRGQNEGKTSEQLVEFAEAVEGYLANTTQLISCDCNLNCQYVETGAGSECTTDGNCKKGPANSTANAVLRFEYEDALTPSYPAIGSTCLFGSTSGSVPYFDLGTAPHYLVPRGCKKRMSLIYTPPTPTTPGPTTPGKLSLVLEDGAGATVRTMHEISGVYSFRCGQKTYADPSTGLNRASPEQFEFQIKLKARATNAPIGAKNTPEYDTWYENDPDDNGKFYTGTHRTVKSNVSFRNLNTLSIHYGKSRSYGGCVPTGDTSSDGNCCSGYRDASKVCIAMDQCLVKNSAAADFGQCCSHKILGGKCL